MQKTNIIELIPNKFQVKILKEMMFLSSCVYNITNYEVRQRIINNQPVPSFFDLRYLLEIKNDYQLLGRCYSLPRIKIYSETNSARFKLINSKSQNKVGLPKYYKNRKTNTTIPSYLVTDGDRIKIEKCKVRIPISLRMRKKHHTGDFKIKYNGILRWKGKQSRSTIHYKNKKFYLHQSVEVKDVELKSSNISASIDLGVKKLFAIKVENGEEKIIGSKRHYKQYCHYDNLIAKENKKLSLIDRYISNKIKRLYNNRSKWQNNLYNNLIAKVFRILNKNNVSTLFVGDIKNIQQSYTKTRKVNNMLNNYWAYDIIYKKLENKCQEHGIKLIKQEESYTSSTCPICGDCSAENKKDRLFLCSFCGYFNDRDIVGATNILKNGMYSQDYQSVHRDEIIPLEFKNSINFIV